MLPPNGLVRRRPIALPGHTAAPSPPEPHVTPALSATVIPNGRSDALPPPGLAESGALAFADVLAGQRERLPTVTDQGAVADARPRQDASRDVGPDDAQAAQPATDAPASDAQDTALQTPTSSSAMAMTAAPVPTGFLHELATARQTAERLMASSASDGQTALPAASAATPAQDLALDPTLASALSSREAARVDSPAARPTARQSLARRPGDSPDPDTAAPTDLGAGDPATAAMPAGRANAIGSAPPALPASAATASTGGPLPASADLIGTGQPRGQPLTSTAAAARRQGASASVPPTGTAPTAESITRPAAGSRAAPGSAQAPGALPLAAEREALSARAGTVTPDAIHEAALPTTPASNATSMDPAAGLVPSPFASAAPAAGGLTLAVPATPDSAEWATAIEHQVLRLAEGDTPDVRQAQLRLDPPELGPLRIQLTLSADSASAVFTSGHPLVRAALEAALPQLTQALEQAGIRLDEAAVQDHPQRDAPSDDADRAQREPSTTADLDVLPAANPAVPRRPTTGLVDAFA